MKHHIEFVYRRSWQPDTDPCDQRWTRTPDVFVGTEEEATREVSELESSFGHEVIFRAVPIAVTAEEEEHHMCATCGGDFRDRIGTPYACTCPVAVAIAGGIRWVKPMVKERAS